MPNSIDAYTAALEAHDCATCEDGPEECMICYVKIDLPEDERASCAGPACRCGDCCERLIIEVDTLDALREPRIAREAAPLKSWDGKGIAGYCLNHAIDRKKGDTSTACIFHRRDANGLSYCDIYNTRPAVCRAFSCADHLAEMLAEQLEEIVEIEVTEGEP